MTTRNGHSGKLRSTRGVWFAVPFLVIVGGCGPVEAPNKQSPAQDSPVQQRAAPESDLLDTGYAVITPPELPDSLRLAAGRYRGELPFPLAYYSQRPVEFDRFIRQRGWIGHKRRRKCKGQPQCEGPNPTSSTMGQADAIEDANRVSLRGLPGNGVVIGRVMNLGSLPEDRYDLPPAVSNRAAQHLYIVVMPASPAPPPGQPAYARQVFARLAFSSSGDPTSLTVEDVVGRFVDCDHGDLPWPFPSGDFRGCTRTAVRRLLPAERQSVLAGNDPLRVLDEFNGLAWMSCAHGCCTSEYPPLTGAEAEKRREREKARQP